MQNTNTTASTGSKAGDARKAGYSSTTLTAANTSRGTSSSNITEEPKARKDKHAKKPSKQADDAPASSADMDTSDNDASEKTAVKSPGRKKRRHSNNSDEEEEEERPTSKRRKLPAPSEAVEADEGAETSESGSVSHTAAVSRAVNNAVRRALSSEQFRLLVTKQVANALKAEIQHASDTPDDTDAEASASRKDKHVTALRKRVDKLSDVGSDNASTSVLRAAAKAAVDELEAAEPWLTEQRKALLAANPQYPFPPLPKALTTESDYIARELPLFADFIDMVDRKSDKEHARAGGKYQIAAEHLKGLILKDGGTLDPAKTIALLLHVEVYRDAHEGKLPQYFPQPLADRHPGDGGDGADNAMQILRQHILASETGTQRAKDAKEAMRTEAGVYVALYRYLLQHSAPLTEQKCYEHIPLFYPPPGEPGGDLDMLLADVKYRINRVFEGAKLIWLQSRAGVKPAVRDIFVRILMRRFPAALANKVIVALGIPPEESLGLEGVKGLTHESLRAAFFAAAAELCSSYTEAEGALIVRNSASPNEPFAPRDGPHGRPQKPPVPAHTTAGSKPTSVGYSPRPNVWLRGTPGTSTGGSAGAAASGGASGGSGGSSGGGKAHAHPRPAPTGSTPRPPPPSPATSSKPTPADATCFNCKRTGHKAADCRTTCKGAQCKDFSCAVCKRAHTNEDTYRAAQGLPPPPRKRGAAATSCTPYPRLAAPCPLHTRHASRAAHREAQSWRLRTIPGTCGVHLTDDGVQVSYLQLAHPGNIPAKFLDTKKAQITE